MNVKIPMRPWKGSWMCPWEEASILAVTDQWHEDSPGLPVHVIEFGGVEILCHGFSMKVEPMDAFLTFTAHNVHEKSWDAFMEAFGGDQYLEGSGRITYDISAEHHQGAAWWPGCDLIVPVTQLELSPLPEQVIA